MKNKIIILIILTILCAISFSYISSKPLKDLPNDKNYWKLVELGRLSKERSEKNNEAKTVMKKGKTLEIFKEDYDILVKELVNLGINESQAVQDAEKLLLRDNALYLIAETNGIYISDQEILDAIKQAKKDAVKASNYSDFEVVLKATGMSYDEYWDSHFNSYKKLMTIEKYKANYLKSISKYKELVDRTPEYLNWVESEFNKVADNYVKNDNVIDIIPPDK